MRIKDPETVRLARCQLADYDAHRPGQLFADSTAALTVEEAYAVQIAMARLRRERGERIVGYKIGCVSPVVRRQLGIEHPVFGHIFESEVFWTPAKLVYSAYRRPAIEGELAVMLGESIPSPQALQEDPHRYVQQIFPVIELHNHELRRSVGPEAELIAANALHAGLVRPDGSASAKEAEGQDVAVWINGEQKGHARADPTATLEALAERLAAYGIPLAAGDLLLTGSPLPLFPVASGDSIRVQWGDTAVVEATMEP